MTVTNEQIQELRAAAENIGAETWHSEGATVWNDEYEVNDEYCKDLIACCENVNNVSVHAQFIAAANPAAILSLLAERDADKALIEVYREAYGEAQHMVWVNWEAAASMNVENEEHKQRIAETDDALCKLLPGVQCMDPTDGGSVTPLEQVSRMVAYYREKISEQARRISELEARTHTVKLPPLHVGVVQGGHAVMVPPAVIEGMKARRVEHALCLKCNEGVRGGCSACAYNDR